MLGYGRFHYRYASGREGDASLVALSSRKNYISLYVLCTDEGGYLAEQYVDRLPKASIGKSCVRFKRTDDIDLGRRCASCSPRPGGSAPGHRRYLRGHRQADARRHDPGMPTRPRSCDSQNIPRLRVFAQKLGIRVLVDPRSAATT